MTAEVVTENKDKKQQIITTVEQLSVDERPYFFLYDWCKAKGDVLALINGTILTTNINSANLSNCRVLLERENILLKNIKQVSPAVLNELFSEDIAKEMELLLRGRTELSIQQKLFHELLKIAIQSQTTDIHIEAREEYTTVRLRRFGEMMVFAKWIGNMGHEVASTIFNMETDTAVANFNPRLAQNASLHQMIDGKKVMARVATVPAQGGFDMVVRVLAGLEIKLMTLAELGYHEDQIYLIQQAMKVPSGAVIIAGPTGSGKTTTIASCLTLLDDSKKVYTIEDPVERLIKEVTQVPINTDEDSEGYARMTRSLLRMDPDDVVIGEIRDHDTAEVMVKTAITGHLVLTTLHAKNAVNIVTRLLDFKIPSALLSDPNLLTCLISQRLVPKLCPSCSRPLVESKEHLNNISHWKKIFGDKISQIKTRSHNQLCPECFGSGVSRRVVAAEVIWVDQKSRVYIQNNDILGWMKYLKEQGWKDSFSIMMDMVEAGFCDPIDIENVVGNLDPDLRVEAYRYRSS